MPENIVTRFCPSPTGSLHIGGVRTALYSYLYAKSKGGKFLLRIEDTDKERSKKEYADDILDALNWVGLKWDNENVPYQSERTELYKGYLRKMVDSGHAYISKETPKEPGDRDEVIRFKNPNVDITWNDLVLGDITFNTKDLGDFVIAKDLDTPLYHLAVVIDDHDMGITHVIRGQEHVSNTPRQILLLEALGFSRPFYGHIPLILAPDKTKLSKRHGAFPTTEYRTMGYLPEALINFVAFIGWNPGGEKEIYSIDEMVKVFDLSKVQKGGGVFNIEKLNWLNREYIKKIPTADFVQLIKEWLPGDFSSGKSQWSDERLAKCAENIRERITTLADIRTLAETGEIGYFFEKPALTKELLKDTTHIPAIIEIIKKIDESAFNAESIKSAIWDFATEKGRGAVLWPMRVALTGKEKSPDPFTMAQILGKMESLERLHHATEI